MIWLFACVVLLLIVFHRGFRKFALWLVGILVAVAGIIRNPPSGYRY
jgi:glycerol uptake facilitator-like aquaporin